MKLSLNIQIPTNSPKEYKPSLEDKCCDYMVMCQSDDNSLYEWKYLKKVYEKLSSAKNIPDNLLPLLEKLEKFMLSYGSLDSGKHVQMDSSNLFKYNKD